MEDGTVIVPAGHPELIDIVEALGDERAARLCRQAGMTEVIIGKRMCG